MSSTSLPAWVEDRLKTAPIHIDRHGLAQLHTELFGPLSPRSLETPATWPLTWRRVNGRAVCLTREAVELAWKRFENAPAYRGGSGRTRKTA
jgi:hypothetical protein